MEFLIFKFLVLHKKARNTFKRALIHHKMRLAIILAALAALPAVLAACPVTISSQNTPALITEIPQLNTDLQGCPTAIPGGLAKLVGSGNVQFNINRNDGTITSLLITTANGQATGVTVGTGASRWTATISEPNLDVILASSNRGQALSSAWLSGKLVLRANTFWQRFTWFFIKPFARSAVKKAYPATTSVRPDYCDETYMNGWTEYVPNKEKWDSYMAQASGICQVQQGHMPDASLCVQSVQLSRGGIPFYLCWYK